MILKISDILHLHTSPFNIPSKIYIKYTHNKQTENDIYLKNTKFNYYKSSIYII